MEQSRKKRERGANYTPEEKSLLADLVSEYKHIIEDKRTSGMFLARKKEGWLKITNKFNSCASSGHRSVEQLKMLYDNWKQKTRKKMAESNIQIHKTGGSYQTKTTDDDDKILSIIKDQIKPLRNPFDSGAAYFRDIDNLHTFQNEIVFREEESAEKPIVIEEIEVQEERQDNNNKKSKTRAKRDVHHIKNNRKYLSAESFKRIYFKRKCQVAYLEKKKLMQEILQQKQQHNLKMQILKLKLSKINSIAIL